VGTDSVGFGTETVGAEDVEPGGVDEICVSPTCSVQAVISKRITMMMRILRSFFM